METDNAPRTQSTHPETDALALVPPSPEAPAASANTSPARSEFFQPATMGLVSLSEDLAEVALSQPEDKATLRRFAEAAESHAQSQGIADAWSVADVAQEAEVELHMINRDSALNIALWVAWLQVTARFLAQEELRYQTLAEFLENYPVFADYEVAEQERLWHTANWMNYLFGQIPAKKNKGLAIQITPKLVEGWHARYVTGSGQTKQTADRVHVYEVEGEIQPYQRVKMNKRKRPAKKVEPKPKKTALGAQETSRPRMEGVEYDEGEDYPALDFENLEADHTLAAETAGSGTASSASPVSSPALAAPASAPASAAVPAYGPTAFSGWSAGSSPSSSSAFFPYKDTERIPTATATAALSPAPAPQTTATPMFEASKYHHAPAQQQQQQPAATAAAQQRLQRSHRRRRLPSGDASYYDNDTSSESMDGDLESLTSPMASGVDHSFGGHLPEPQLGPELIGLSRLPSWNPADNPPIPSNGHPLTMGYQPQTSAPRLARLCSWGTTQPEPQIGDHTRSLQDLPAFPAARPNGYGMHNGDPLFANDLGDGMDPLELFLNSNFDFDNSL